MNSISTLFSFLFFIIKKALSALFFIIFLLAFIFIILALADSALTGGSKVTFSAFFLVIGALSFFVSRWLWSSSTSLNQTDSTEVGTLPTLNLTDSKRRFQPFILLCFLIWTPLLITETLQVQHSCYPMIHWTGEFSPECRSKYKPQPTEAKYSKANPAIPPTRTSYSSPSSSSVQHSGSSSSNVGDIAGGIVGMAGATGAAIAGAPVAAVVGIGIALWFFIRSIMS